MNDSESLYDAESIGNYGSVKMGVSFDENLNLLTVSLRQAIDLNAKRQVIATSYLNFSALRSR